MAASMGAFLLAGGTKGKRFALPHSTIMIHQPSGGAQGQATELQIVADHIAQTKRTLNEILAENTGQPYEVVEKDTDRDNYMTAEEAKVLDSTVVAIDGIAMIVNPENPIADLSLEEIAQIYTGEVENWQELGGDDAPIVCIGREAASGTRDGFESITGTEDVCQYDQELTSTGDVVQTVASNPNAIGYASLASVQDTVKAISVEGVAPTHDTIMDGTYKIQRNFIFATLKGEALSETAQAFFDFATSTAANSLIEDAGAIPVAK